MNSPLWRRRRDLDLDDEIAAHFQMAVADRLERGQSREEAERAARLEFGNVTRTKEDVRDAWGRAAVEALGDDIRYALRVLRRSPGFTATAVLTLAVGIGAATLVFSVINGVLLRPLPIVAPHRVVTVERRIGADGTTMAPHAYPDFREIERRDASFAGLAAWSPFTAALDVGTNVTRETPSFVTGNYFDVLGVRTPLGRLLTPADDTDDAPPVVVLSHDFWTASYQANPGVIGATVHVTAGRAAGLPAHKPFTIVGVAPKGFYGVEPSSRPSAWMPLHSLMPEARLASRDTPGPGLAVFGRLKDGVSTEGAQSNVTAMAINLAEEQANADANYRVVLTEPGWMANSAWIRRFASGLSFLAVLVVLTASASVAIGLTARIIDRHREMGLRIALGASRFRVVRLILTETLVIAAAGAALSSSGVVWVTRFLSGLTVTTGDQVVQVDVHPDGRVFAVAMAGSIVVSLLAVIAPSRLIVMLDPNATMKGVPGWFAGCRWGVRDVLTAAQVVFSCVLVGACVLSLVGVRRALATPLGFNADRIATVTLDFDVAGYSREQQRLFMERAAEDVRGLPGVESVAYVTTVPVAPAQIIRAASNEGRMAAVEASTPVVFYGIAGDFFKTMGIRFVNGQGLQADDTSKAVVNETFVRQVLRSDRPSGARVHVGAPPLRAEMSTSLEIVGVVLDGKYRAIIEPPQAAIFTPLYDTPFGRPTMLVRTSTSVSSTAAMVRQRVAGLDAGLPARNIGGAKQLMALAFLPNRAAAVILTGFGVVALILAMTGIHGAASYAVVSRGREIGVRVALGAGRVNVLRLVLRRILLIGGAGILCGMVATVALGRVLTQVVSLASSNEPVVLSAVAIVMVLVVAAALFVPSIQSLRIQPMVALRSE